MTTLPSNLGDSGIPLTHGPGAPRPYAPHEVQRLNRGGDPATDFNRVSTRIDTVLRIGLSARPERRDYPPDSALGRAVKLHDVLLRHLREFAVTAREALDSGSYTPIGLRKRLLSIGGDALLRVESAVAADTMRPAVVRIRDRAAAEVADALKSPTSEPVPFERESEARAMLYKMTPTERAEAWRGIVERRDALGIAAVVNAPKFAPVLDDRTVAEGVKALAEASNPKAVKTRDEANEALWSIDEMTKDVRTMIAHASGIDLSPVREGLSGADRGSA
jgi:hypothetical protein